MIGFSDHVALWVTKIKAHVARRGHVNRAQNADHAAKTCDRFVYSIVKVTKLYDYQTCQTFFERFIRCSKVCGLFFLIVLLGR